MSIININVKIGYAMYGKITKYNINNLELSDIKKVYVNLDDYDDDEDIISIFSDIECKKSIGKFVYNAKWKVYQGFEYKNYDEIAIIV
jgi:poly-D-alanine transfer protein DltD